MNVLITGGAGFIGSNLAKELINKNYKVTVLDLKKEPENLSDFIDDVTYIHGDVRDKELITKIIKERLFEGIVHLAAVSRVIWGEQNPKACIDININGTKTILESIKMSELKPWFIFGSSREVYGESSKFPICEECKKKPINVYGSTKIAGEYLVKEYSKELGLESAILRFSNVYGNEKDIQDRVIPRFINSALKGDELQINGGNQLFDFTHIQDTVNGILKTVKKLENNGGQFHTEDFHILTGKGTTLQDIIQIISEYSPDELNVTYNEPRSYDVERFVGDPKKAYDLLNFNAEILPDKGIPTTIENYKEVFDL